ncbi:retrovirus-related Pol polyprotein from transposon opus [Trichonephila clavata]|uniref:RNA-directed DNA polymerase n=1 Tax=Trichonephila clavata TaxID=2740835 RepID=A0A8X6L454_TRICU|nr:retrovirus-related Pol polyprotein from transposon opus [Trichonephila clavata]
MCRTQRNKQKNVAARRVNAIEENCENSETIYIGELKSVNELDTKETNCVWPLNEAILRHHYPIPTADALVTKLKGGKVFTILDAKNGFWQLPLDEESSYITTFCTPWGRYRFLVLPFGLNSAPEEFQKAMDEIYEEDEDINPYFDDIALGSSTVEEHCRLLLRTLLKARKANLKLNELKTQLSQTSINYLGHVLLDEGIKPDPKKIRAIEQFATPNCREDLQRFLGKNLVIADALSRAQSTTDKFDEVLGQEATVRINLLTQASPTKWEEIAKMTTDDPEMQDVLFHINNGWPEKRKTKIAAQPYWHCKEELYSTKERIICRGQRLVVPVKYRKEIFKLLHVSHKGVVSSKIKAREYFYWPNLNRDVEEYVSKCKICQKYQRENQKEILINPEIPGRPWQKVACDFFCLKGKEHLLMIDYLSKYVELKPFNSTTAQSVITVMKSIYATHGIPEDLVSDGGPPFNSNLMTNFFREWGIKHVTPPHFPRANGQIERAVQTVKNSLTKAAEEGKDLYVVLLDYKIQPAKDMPSPAELLMGRKLRSFLPITSRIPNNSADSQVNSSPKSNKSNINQQLQVPIENCSEQSNPVVRKSSRNIVKPVRYRDN